MEIHINDKKTVYVAYDHDTFLGQLRVEPCVEGFEVCRVLVEEEFRGRGVASALLRHVIRDYQDKKLVGYTDKVSMGRVFENAGFKHKSDYAFYELGG